MAKLYYCNNGDIELRHETLQALRAMPDSWTVLLNCCPAGKNVDREIDALVITQKALHLIEFKYRTAPVHIKTDSSWLAGNYEIRSNWGESPKEQVTNTDTAFKQWLQQTLPELKQHTLPWVVLERHNNLNRIGTNAFNPGFYERLGHVMVLSGVEKLTGALQSREKSAKNLPHRIKDIEQEAKKVATAAAQSASEAAASKEAQEELARIERERWEKEKADRQRAEELLVLRKESLMWSAIVGAAGGIIALQPIPFADNLILAPMQIGLVMWIGKLYKRDLTSDLALKIMGSIGLGLFAQHATVLAYKMIPGAWGLGAITVPAFTIFLGAMMSLYFEKGEFPDKSEQKQLFKGVKTALTDKELLEKMKTMGSVLAEEIKAKGYRLKPEDMRDIFAKNDEQGKGIGERLAQLLGFNMP